MILHHHKTLTPERWFRFTLFEQLGNVGADVGRTIKWQNLGRAEDSRCAFERALELLDLTVMDPKNKGARLKELLRVREAIKDHFWGDNVYCTTDEQWDSYFYDFAYAAAIAKGK